DLRDIAIEKRHESGVEFGTVPFDAAQQVFEIVEIGDLHVLLVAELVDHARHRVAADLPRVDRLRRAPACARACGEGEAVGAVVFVFAHGPYPTSVAPRPAAYRAPASRCMRRTELKTFSTNPQFRSRPARLLRLCCRAPRRRAPARPRAARPRARR